MKSLFSIITLALLVVLPAQGEGTLSADSGLVKCKFLVGDYYFLETPMGVEFDPMYPVMNPKDISGSIAVFPDTTNLTADDRRYAIPKERVANLAEIEDVLKNGKWTATPSQKQYQIDPEALKVGDAIGTFDVVDVEGNHYTDNSTFGRPLVLNFWFTGCGPCIKEMPILSQWIDKIPNATYLAVTFNSPSQIKGIVDSRGFRFRQIASDSQLYDKFRTKSYPLTVIIDKKGIIRMVMYGTSVQKRDVLFSTLQQVSEE